MKYRHVTVFVFVGWYLLAPPLTADLKLASDQPLTKWNHLGSYDSAKECEMNRLKLYQAALNSKATEQLGATMKISEMAAECIQTDDPRLAK